MSLRVNLKPFKIICLMHIEWFCRIFFSSFFYVFCKRGHKDIAKQSISEDQSADETRKIVTAVQCIHWYHFFYTEANSNKYNNNFLSNLSADYCIPGDVILTLIKLNSYICLFEKFQLLHYCYTAILN